MEIKKNKKCGTEKTIKHKNGKIIVGTIDRVNCNAAYIKLETWVTVEESLTASIQAIRRRIIANRNTIFNIYFQGLNSSLIDIAYNKTKGYGDAGKKSFISIEITLLADDRFIYDEDFIFNSQAFGDTLFSLLESLSDKFSMSVSKK